MKIAPNRATVVGGHGFIGAALVTRLRDAGTEVVIPERGAVPLSSAGHVFFCAGLTADFRVRLHDTMATHVALAQVWLAECRFQSFTYLSSTRVYAGQSSGREEARIAVDPADPSDFYNISKLAGEALVLTDPRPTARVVRLSNIFGASDRSDNFLTSVVGDAVNRQRVHIGTGPSAAKDYLAVEDAVEAIARMPLRAESRLVNIASGTSTDNATIGAALAERTGAEITYGTASTIGFPTIDIARMRGELGIEPEDFRSSFARMLRAAG